MAEVEAEREMSRTEVAAYLHEFADKLGGERPAGGETSGEQPSNGEFIEAPGNETDTEESSSDDTDRGTEETTQGERGGNVTFTVGNESATVNPPDTVRFEMAVDSTSGMLESSARETVEFALHWDTEETDEDGDGALDIQ